MSDVKQETATTAADQRDEPESSEISDTNSLPHESTAADDILGGEGKPSKPASLAEESATTSDSKEKESATSNLPHYHQDRLTVPAGREPARGRDLPSKWPYDLHFTGPFRFLDLRVEIRRKIYRRTFRSFEHFQDGWALSVISWQHDITDGRQRLYHPPPLSINRAIAR